MLYQAEYAIVDGVYSCGSTRWSVRAISTRRQFMFCKSSGLTKTRQKHEIRWKSSKHYCGVTLLIMVLDAFCWISMATYRHGSYADYFFSRQEGVRQRAMAPHSPEQDINAHIKLVELLIRLQKGGE